MPLDDYVFEAELNSGALSKVYRCKDIETGEQRAVKLLDLTVYGDVLWKKEVHMLTKFQYVRGIIKMYEFGQYIDDQSNHLMGFIILELCDHDLKDEPIRPDERFTLVKFLIKTIYLIHQLGFVLADLKLENILRKGRGFRICDLATCQEQQVETASIVGTDHVLAPEIIVASQRHTFVKYTDKVDVWCIGCIVFEIYANQSPFNNANPNESVRRLHQNILWLEPKLELIQSKNIKRFVKKALQKNPQNRPSVLQLGNLL